MGAYFSKYKIYYNALQGKNLIGPANSLSSSISNGITSAKNNFNQVSGSKWNEQAKVLVINLILSNIQSNLTKLNSFASSNLVSACTLAEQLYSKVETIKVEDEILDENLIELSILEKQLYNIPPKISVITKDGQTIYKDNQEYNRLLIQINSKKRVIESQKSKLAELCMETDQIIEQIEALNGDVSIQNSASISLDKNYNNFFGDIDIDSLINEYDGDYVKIAGFLAQNLRLPEGFRLLTKTFVKDSSYGIVGDFDGLIVKVGYKSLTGTLYIPLDNGTTNLGIIMSGGSKDNRYTSSVKHIFEEHKFDSVVFVPNHDGKNNEEAAYQNDDIRVLKAWVNSFQDTYGLETITGYAHSNGCRDMTNLIIELNKEEEVKFSNVLLMNPSSNILYNQKVDIPAILKENNVTIETGVKDGYYADPQYNYVAETVIDKYSSIGGGVFVQEATDMVKDIYETNEANNKYLPQNKHSCRWFTYLSGSFTDSNGKEITMKNLIDNNI